MRFSEIIHSNSSDNHLVIFRTNAKHITTLSQKAAIDNMIKSIEIFIEKNDIYRLSSFEIGCSFETLNRKNFDTTHLSLLWLEFGEKYYSLADEICEVRIEKLYSEEIEPEEINQVINKGNIKHKNFLEDLLNKFSVS